MILTITGVDTRVRVCQCCGKQGLRKTVILTERDSLGAKPTRFLRYGTECARVATRFKGPDIVKQARKFEQSAELIRSIQGPDATPSFFGWDGI